MLVGILTLVGAMVLSYVVIGGIVLTLSLNKRFVRWYSKKAVGLVGEVMDELSTYTVEMIHKLELNEEKAE